MQILGIIGFVTLASRHVLTLTVVGCATLMLACGGAGDDVVERTQTLSARDEMAAAPVRSDLSGPLVVALGDSLTAGLGLDIGEAYPALLERRLRADGYEVTVVNAGVSGDTTAAGLSRAEWALEGDVRILIIALGGNDGLRGLPVTQMKRNLNAIIALARDRGASVLLAGMEAPPNFGATYTDQFRAVFSELADDHEVVFMPFLLEGVAADPTLNQADGVHPTAEGAAIVAQHVYGAVQPLLPTLTSTPH